MSLATFSHAAPPNSELRLKFTFNNFSPSFLEFNIFMANWFIYSEANNEYEKRTQLSSELISTIELYQKKYKPEFNTNISIPRVIESDENTMTLKNVELIKRYIETNDLEYKIEIKRRNIPDDMIEEVRKIL